MYPPTFASIERQFGQVPASELAYDEADSLYWYTQHGKDVKRELAVAEKDMTKLKRRIKALLKVPEDLRKAREMASAIREYHVLTCRLTLTAVYAAIAQCPGQQGIRDLADTNQVSKVKELQHELLVFATGYNKLRCQRPRTDGERQLMAEMATSFAAYVEKLASHRQR